MGKTVTKTSSKSTSSKSASSTKETSRSDAKVSSKTKQVKAVKPVAVEKEEDSIAVQMKKANDLKMKKWMKSTQAKVNERVDLKQIILAAKALKQYAKKQSESVAEKALLNDEDQSIHVTFTMTQVATNPSPKPQMLTIDHPFNTEAQNSRICVIVKDPSREFKDQI